MANNPGGGDGTGPAVTLVNNGNGTVTMANGIVSLVCSTASATINQIYYTYNNSGTTFTNQLLANGTDGGKLYWETGGFGTGAFTYSAVANTGDYCEIDLLSSSSTSGVMDVHFSMLRGSPGFYVTAIFSHRSQDSKMNMGETRDNIYAGAIFNWMSVDAARNKLMEVQPTAGSLGVFGAPVECYLWTNGIYEGRYEDKYKYSADFGVQRVWGWSSVGTGGANVGLWQVTASPEYYSDGPMKRDLMSHIGTTILNYYESSHYGAAATDGNWGNGEVWSKVYGPYFIYCNNVTNTITGANQAAQMLYSDALAQAAAEATAWPYAWFTNADYASASQRGTVTGQMAINDGYNPNASPAGLWVGVVQQPTTISNVYDFQQWMKTCQFWAQTGSNGNFTIPNVIAGTNYTLYAFGPGAEGTFMSQNQTGGSPPNTFNLPSAPFSVTVTAEATDSLGTVTWTPTRVGATVFEIGYPSRWGQNKFRHGEDYWVGDIGPGATEPMPIWSKFLEYPFDFPNGPDYVVGQSRWSTDWNFVQPCVVDSDGIYDDSSSTITFNLASAPANGATASFYMALCSDYQGAIEVSVNGTQISPANGYSPNYSGSGNECDTTVREGINADSSDYRINFSGSLLQAGQNTINIYMRQTGKKLVDGIEDGYFADHAMYDYLRLELTGYVPPPPAGIAAYPGNNCNLISWPVTPGSTSYDIYSSTTSGSGYSLVASGVTGPVCGSGFDNATYLDTNAVNGATYYYVVQSVNSVGASADSPQSSGVTPSSGISSSGPAAPMELTVSSAVHHSVTINWSASAGADFYTIYRSTLYDNGGGASNTLDTIVLDNTNTGTTYTDTSPTDGSIYSYSVTATSAGGTSANSASAVAIPLPSPPASPPGNVTVTAGSGQTNYFIYWSPVPGAVGYIVSRYTNSTVPLNYSTFVMSITETNWSDTTNLSADAQYFYMITAVNAGGIASAAVVAGPPGVPAALGATAGNAEVLLEWSATPGASSYTILRGTSSGGESVLATGITATSYVDTGLNNGTTYYYEVEAVGGSGTSAKSIQASATPSSTIVSGLVWSGANGSIWNMTATNWLNGLTAAVYADGDSVVFNDSAATVTVLITNAVSPANVLFANSTLNYAVTAVGPGISGTTSLIKTNAAGLTLNGTNSFSGGIFLDDGTLTVSSANAEGTGAITLNAGTLTLGAVITNAIDVTGVATLLPGAIDYSPGPLLGGGLLNISITGGNTFSPEGDMSGFSGTNELGSSTGFYRFYGSFGSSAAAFDLGTSTATMLNRNGGVTIQLGSLSRRLGRYFERRLVHNRADNLFRRRKQQKHHVLR